MIVYTNVKRKKDVVHFDSQKGIWTWTAYHKPGTLGRYLGDDGSKAEFFWDEDGMVPYHGW